MKRFLFGLVCTCAVVVVGCSNATNSTNDGTLQLDTSTEEISSSTVDTDTASKPEAFDMDIKNNSLAVSPDESIAVVYNSTIPEIKVYDLKEKKF